MTIEPNESESLAAELRALIEKYQSRSTISDDIGKLSVAQILAAARMSAICHDRIAERLRRWVNCKLDDLAEGLEGD